MDKPVTFSIFFLAFVVPMCSGAIIIVGDDSKYQKLFTNVSSIPNVTDVPPSPATAMKDNLPLKDEIIPLANVKANTPNCNGDEVNSPTVTISTEKAIKGTEDSNFEIVSSTAPILSSPSLPPITVVNLSTESEKDPEMKKLEEVSSILSVVEKILISTKAEKENLSSIVVSSPDVIEKSNCGTTMPTIDETVSFEPTVAPGDVESSIDSSEQLNNSEELELDSNEEAAMILLANAAATVSTINNLTADLMVIEEAMKTFLTAAEKIEEKTGIVIPKNDSVNVSLNITLPNITMIEIPKLPAIADRVTEETLKIFVNQNLTTVETLSGIKISEMDKNSISSTEMPMVDSVVTQKSAELPPIEIIIIQKQESVSNAASEIPSSTVASTKNPSIVSTEVSTELPATPEAIVDKPMSLTVKIIPMTPQAISQSQSASDTSIIKPETPELTSIDDTKPKTESVTEEIKVTEEKIIIQDASEKIELIQQVGMDKKFDIKIVSSASGETVEILP